MAIIQVYEGKKLTEYQLPDTWADVKLYQYCTLMKALHNEDSGKIALMIRTVEALTDMNLSQVNQIPYKYLFKVYEHLIKLITIEPEKDLTFKIQGENKVYGFHPHLNGMTMGEFVDLETALENPHENMAEVMAILYRPIIDEEGEKYMIDDYTGTKEEDIEFMQEFYNIHDAGGGIGSGTKPMVINASKKKSKNTVN